jgi:hypothetical protein
LQRLHDQRAEDRAVDRADPPESAVPPITAAAITRSSSSVPMSLEWKVSASRGDDRRDRAERAHQREDLDRQRAC